MRYSTKEIIKSFAKNEYSPQVVKKIHKWLIQEENLAEKDDALHSVWELTNAIESQPINDSLDAVFRKIEATENSTFIINTKKKISIKSFLVRIAAIAVIILLSSIITLLLVHQPIPNTTLVECFAPSGTMKEIVLPDGSNVILNSGSILLYPDLFNGKDRTVYLIGEANFKVKKNEKQPFIVKSSTMDVTALGTEFNISAYIEDKNLIATLISGKVKVDLQEENKSYILSPGEQVIYDKEAKKSALLNTSIDDAMGWTKGQLIFRGATIDQILSVMEKRYNVSFQYNSSKTDTDKYNMRFKSGTTIEQALSILNHLAGPFTYQKEENIYKLTIKK